MLTPTRGISLDTLARASLAPTTARASFNDSTTSFAQQLAESLENYLGQSSDGTRLEIEIMPANGLNPGTRQFIVTVKEPPANALAKGSVSLATIALSAALPASTPAPGIEPAPDNEIDAYWASQPKEVQALHHIQDFEERGFTARRLAQQGFVIDYAIMVLGWDPYMTMKGRLEEGYTWIPSIEQNPIPVAPGISFPGLPPYDPAHPPPKSVAVTLDFARGLEHTTPSAVAASYSNRPSS